MDSLARRHVHVVSPHHKLSGISFAISYKFAGSNPELARKTIATVESVTNCTIDEYPCTNTFVNVLEEELLYMKINKDNSVEELLDGVFHSVDMLLHEIGGNTGTPELQELERSLLI